MPRWKRIPEGIDGGLAASLPRAARVVAAADAYRLVVDSGTQNPDVALRDHATAGRLDAQIVEAVLVAAGHGGRATRQTYPAGLTAREVEVLVLAARGHSVKQIAAQLFISAKTADRHIQNIYTKIGVSTRGAAALFAMENDLLA
ncbi:MAG: helix-turn-helix transcriptional regulator [Nocardiaceae bacterium]|nr:helix-turn-helix transcriptional regulator [Nocardiaceae bacterium]